jgi:chemotaxis signal transduction protein
VTTGDAPTGIVFELGPRKFFLDFDRVAFIAPARHVVNGRLTLPRGEIPLIDLRERLGLPHSDHRRRAVAVKGRFGFYALAVDKADLAFSLDRYPGLEIFDLDVVVPEDEERRLFAVG